MSKKYILKTKHYGVDRLYEEGDVIVLSDAQAERLKTKLIDPKATASVGSKIDNPSTKKLEKENEALRASNSDLQAKLSDAEDSLTISNVDRDESEEESKNLKTQVEDLCKEIDGLRSQIAVINKDTEKLVKENTELRKALDEEM